ncbi:hypothetical protein PINS_up023360 [Pythium insidiosum]|nr:hypothetical protein PINS_up023360 [Pythium insidiosum]
MAAPRAGPLPTKSDLIGEIAFRRGERSKNPRKGENRQIRFTVCEGFNVLLQKIMRFLDEPPFSSDGTHVIETDVYFKASKNAPQTAYKPLTRETFELLLQERWSNITQADVDKVAGDEVEPARVAVNVAASFSFQFFVYVSSTGSTTAPAALRRATAARIISSTQAVADFARTQSYLGPITTNHLVISHARQPEGTGVHLRDDNTTRQAQALDEMIRDADQPQPEDNDTAIIDVEIGGAWVKLRVRVSSLRAALRLPQHDIFSRGIFHGFTPTAPTPVLPDMRDQDHAGSDEDEDMVV